VKIKVDIDHVKKSDCPLECKERQFYSLLLGQVEVSMYYSESQFDLCSSPATPPKKILTSRIDYNSIKLFKFPRKTSHASVELGMSKESRVLSHFHTVEKCRTT